MKLHGNREKGENTICGTCSRLFPSEQKTLASWDCPSCLGMKEIQCQYAIFDLWYREDGGWGIPEGMSFDEALDMLQSD